MTTARKVSAACFGFLWLGLLVGFFVGLQYAPP